MLSAAKERIVKVDLDKIDRLAREISAKISEYLLVENMTGAEVSLALSKAFYIIVEAWIEYEKETAQHDRGVDSGGVMGL